jgi:hypothetical protein
MFDLQSNFMSGGTPPRMKIRRPWSAVIFKEEQFMDPVATLFLVLIIILVVASILIPQLQERRRR